MVNKFFDKKIYTESFKVHGVYWEIIFTSVTTCCLLSQRRQTSKVDLFIYFPTNHLQKNYNYYYNYNKMAGWKVPPKY